MPQTTNETQTPPAEAQLLRHVSHLAGALSGQRAILFHFSRLQRHNRRDKHLQIAANMLEEVVQRFSGRLFVLAAGDIVLTCKGARRKTLDGAVELIRYLFQDDPLAQYDDAGSDFCSLFDLESDYDRFLALVRRLNEAREKRAASDRPRRQVAPPRPRRPLDPAHLGDILGVINRADLSNVVRRQTVWSLVPDAPQRRLFDELFVSIEELSQALAPDYQLGTDRWLFQYLTQALDRRVLWQLVRDHAEVARGLSINVNVATLLSPEFEAFEDHLPVRARGKIVLELQLADIWSDFGAYLFAENLAKQHGYRLSLDGVRHRALPLIDARQLGVDYVKLVWEDGLLAFEAEEQQEFRRALAAVAPARVILMRCDRPEAVSFGQAAGISLFQGWHMDRLARD
jgi:EAL domain-containing protein (putative c-di-GMP-specific phosphodiesterase class I)